MKKCFAWVLTLIMTCQLLPLTVWAAELEHTVETEVVEPQETTTVDPVVDAYLQDNPTTMDDAAAANLNSIWQQLESTGMVFYNALDTSTKVLDLSNWDDAYLSATVTGTTTYIDIGTITIPAGEASSFRWDLIGENPSSGMSLGATDVRYVNSGETLYLINSTGEDKTYTITLAYFYTNYDGTLPAFDGYSGTILNAIQFSSPVNMMFYQQETFRDNGTVFLGYNKSYAFYGYNDGWNTAYAGASASSDPVIWDGSQEWGDTGTVWSLMSTADFNNSDYKLFEKTAEALFGDGIQSYSVKMDWTLSGITTTNLSAGYPNIWMENATAWPYECAFADNGAMQFSDAMGVASYTHTYTTVTDGIARPYGYDVGLTYPYYNLSGNTTYAHFSLNTTSGDYADYNTLEMVVQGNSIPTTFKLKDTPAIWYINTSGDQVSGSFASRYKTYTHNRFIEIYDVTAPTVTAVYANNGFTSANSTGAGTYNYDSGRYVPITLEFSEPVDGSKLSVTINGTEYSAEELHMNTTSATQTAWYQVQAVDNINIVVSGVSNIVDLKGNTTSFDNNGGENWSCTNVTLESVLMRNSVEGSYVDTELKTVALTLNQDTAYLTKYAAYDTSSNLDKMAPFKAQVVAPDGSNYGEAVQFYLTEDEVYRTLSAYAELPDLPIVDDAQTYTVEIYAHESTTDTEGFHLWWYDGSYGSEAKIQLESVEIVYDDSTITTLSLSESYRPALSVNYTPSNLTSPGGTWSSSDTDIATIDETGNVLLTGNKVGTVNFTFTANNGTETTSDDKTATTHDYTVLAGDNVSLLIPDTFQNIVVRQGNGTTVFWSSNANLMPGYSTVQYKVEVFEGNFATADAITGTAVYTSELFTDTTNSYVIPAGVFNNIGTYTIRVSIPATATTVELTALAWVTVNAQVAGISLTSPSSLYLTDTQTANISWDITNFGTTTDASLTITRVQEDSTASTYVAMDLYSGSGSYTFQPATVASNALKDTYMFSAKASNNATDADDIDGFIMYVYNDDALDIELGGVKKDATTLSNTSAVSGGNLTTDTQEILALREELALIEYIGINYDDYSWSMLKDGIAWSTDSDVVSINYKQGSLYENLDNFTMETYLPQTQMLLSSVTDGTATITATHANTGMSDSVEITVETLRNEFYLFQISPMVTTELTYTDGDGTKKTVTTNSEGYLALYEPKGIDSDVTLRAESGGTVYLGTIYQADLTSGERDSTMLQLYPLNSTTMRQVAQLDLYVTNPDGSPFVGSLTLRGGVYVDGAYRQEAQMQGNANTNLQSGATDQTVNITDGYFTVYYNSVQFVDAGVTLTANNDIQYILELSDIINGSGTEYYPQLVTSNATLSIDDIMYSASSIITLEDATGNLDTPFITKQYFLYNGLSRELDIKTFTGRIGPNANYTSATVYTDMFLWGQTIDPSGSGYTIYAVDENGYQPGESMNASAEFTYPFSSIPLVRNTLTLTRETMTTSGWITEMTDRGLKLRLESSGTLVQEKTLPWRVLDMTNAEDVLANADVSTMVSEMLSGSALGSSDSDSSGNAIISGLMGFVTPFIGDIGGSPFNIIITPTENNAVFNCLIWGGYDGMGLDEVDYSDTGLALESDVMNASISMTGVSDLMGMAGGDSDDDTGDSTGTGSWSASFEGQLQGYYQGEITYNFTTGKWEMHVLEGGFTAGFQGAASFSVDASASGIPLFLEIELGGAVQLDFKMATRYQQIGSNVWADSVTSDTVNDYLTTLRLIASAGVFGGIGFDYSIISFKIGPYGEASIDSSNLFLTRDYLADSSLHNTDGQYLSINGEIGAKMEAKFLIFSTEVIFGSGSASYAWDWGAAALSDYWAEAGTYGTGLGGTGGYSVQYADSAVTTISNGTTLQSRAYLDEASVWASPSRSSYGISTMALDTTSSLDSLQSNANPSSYPVVSDDGYHLLYINDQDSPSIYANRVYAGVLSGTTYTQGSAIDDNGYGDSDVSLAGDSSFAAATWVRMTSDIEGKDAGDAVTTNEQVLLLNSTEVMVSLWNGSTWETTTLTTNGTPDIAPVVATNGTDKAIVAWRSVYSGTGDDLMTFDAQDYILYSVYDGDTWSEAKTLYNGSAGSVMGLDAQMLSDGTAMVAYSIDRDNTDDHVTDYEIAYSIVDTNGDLSLATVVTSDDYLDENPQIVVADFGDEQTSDQRFVLGWYTSVDNVGDIRLLAVNSDGIVSNSFPESLAKITATTATTISSDFQFARMDAAHNDLENLTILWQDIITTDTGAADYSTIRAVSFTVDGSNIGLTAMADLAELPSGTLLDHFDAYVSDTNEVKSVIQSTYYNSDNSTPVEYSWYDSEDMVTKYSTVYIPRETTMLYTATQLFENRVEVQAAIPDYQNLALNAYNAIQFSVFNGGLEDMEQVKIVIDGQIFTFENLDLAPNDSKILTCWYAIGATASDTTYALTATFESGDTKTVNGNIYLDYPDLGISQMTVVKEENGIRTIRMSLYNSSIATLAGKTHRSVEIAFYDGADSDTANAQTLTYTGIDSGITFDNGVLTITGEDNLERIDNGVFLVELTYDVKDYVETTLSETEIPDYGVRLYADVHTVDNSRVLPELNSANNIASVSFDSLVSRTGQTITMDIDQSTVDADPDDYTTATISLRNNSLQTQAAGGAMIVSLLDGDGATLEQQQVYIGEGTMAGEAIYSETVDFTQVGASVSVAYGELETGSDTLLMLTLAGQTILASDFTTNWSHNHSYVMSSVTSGNYDISIIPTDNAATVTLKVEDSRGATVDYPLTDNAATINLPYVGWTEICIIINNTEYYYITTYTDAAPITITFVAGANGSVTPSSVNVNQGTKWCDIASQATVTPDAGYLLDGWYVGEGALEEKITNINDTFDVNTTVTAKFVEQSTDVPLYISSTLMPSYLTLTPADGNIFNSSQYMWKVAQGADAVFTLEVDTGEQYYVSNVQYQIERVTQTIYPDANGVFTIPCSHVEAILTIWATTAPYYIATFQADGNSTMDTVTYHASGLKLYETLEDLKNYENAITTLPVPTANTDYRLAADTELEPLWTEAGSTGYTTAEIWEIYWSKNYTFTVNTVSTAYAQWDIAFVAGDHGAVSNSSDGTYTDGDILTVPTPNPDAGYQFSHWTDSDNATVTLDSTIMAIDHNTYTANFKVGTWLINYDFTSYDWLYNYTDATGTSPAPYFATHGENVQFKLVANEGYTVPDLVYTIDGGSEIELLPDGNGVYTISGDEILGEVLISDAQPKTPQTIYFTNTTLATTLGGNSFFNTPTGANTTVTYTSSNQDVATVNASGMVTMVGAGTTTITATAAEDSTYQSATASYFLTVHQGTISPATDQMVVFDASYADLKQIILTVGGAATALTQSGNKLSGYAGYTFNNGVLGEVNQGSVEVTLYKEFLATLPEGSYSVAITTNSGENQATINATIPAKTTHSVTVINEGSGTSGTFDNQPYGTIISLSAGANSGYSLSNWTATGDVSVSGNQCMVLGDGTVTANWVVSTSSATSYYGSTVATTQNGTVTLSGSKNTMNETVTITATPDDGYAVDTVTVTYASGKDVSVTAQSNGTYTYLQPGAAVTVSVTFVSIDDDTGTGTGTSGFTDVDPNAYYYEAVLWAVENGVTSGVTATTFEPNSTANRAQTVTFLWRAMGCPEVEADIHFTDVTNGSYYYDAMIWAVENGITSGTTATTFAPTNTATRGQIVTFLWRLAGCPMVEGDGMSDINPDAYYYNAVLWAVSQGITTGYADGTFRPNDLCTRGQIVTFLYRYVMGQ